MDKKGFNEWRKNFTEIEKKKPHQAFKIDWNKLMRNKLNDTHGTKTNIKTFFECTFFFSIIYIERERENIYIPPKSYNPNTTGNICEIHN